MILGLHQLISLGIVKAFLPLFKLIHLNLMVLNLNLVPVVLDSGVFNLKLQHLHLILKLSIFSLLVYVPVVGSSQIDMHLLIARLQLCHLLWIVAYFPIAAIPRSNEFLHGAVSIRFRCLAFLRTGRCSTNEAVFLYSCSPRWTVLSWKGAPDRWNRALW